MSCTTAAMTPCAAPQGLAAHRMALRVPARCRALALRARRTAQRVQLRRGVGAAAEGPDPSLAELPEPDTSRGAIAIGLKLTEARQWERAQQYFERALELPGTGIKRFRDKPAGVSPGEKCSALYNIACCQAALGAPENIQNGLLALAGCLEAGYDDFRQLRTDPDLANIRADDKFEGLLKRFDRGGGFMGLFKSL